MELSISSYFSPIYLKYDTNKNRKIYFLMMKEED